MLLTTFLNILGSSVGFLSALFFALGTIRLRTKDIVGIAGTYWDFNLNLADSIASQRAEYIAGALLLLLSFSLQLSANLVPPTSEPFLLQSFGCAISEIAAAFALLLVRSVLFRNAIAKSTRKQVRLLQAEQMAAAELATKSRVP